MAYDPSQWDLPAHEQAKYDDLLARIAKVIDVKREQLKPDAAGRPPNVKKAANGNE